MLSEAFASARAIQVEGLAKQYRIGALARSAYQYGSLRESLALAAARGARRVQSLIGGRWRAGERADRIWALDGVSFTVARGEVVGVIGSNGAGKSTLLKLLSRITKPTRGWAELRGRVGSLLEVGTGFHQELTGRDNVYLNGAILGMRRAEIARRFDAIVEFSGVSAFIDTPVKRYSSGMHVRLAFAVAAHLEPEILLVDEVLAVGDAEFQKRCLGKMHEVVSGGRTILFVSHNMAAVKILCHRAIWLDRGRIAADGGVDAVVDQYLSKDGPVATHGHVPADAPRVGSGEARIRRIALQNRRGADVGQLYLGQPFRVVLTIEVARAIADAVVGLGISAFDGTQVASSFSTDGGRSPFDLSTGWHRIAIDVDVTLLPRAYTLDCTIVRSSGYDVDTVNRVLDFSVLGVAESGNDRYRWNVVRGFVRPSTVWHDVERVQEEQPFQTAERT
jgi:lipopolysaccharide transport system ATP-binding protein